MRGDPLLARLAAPAVFGFKAPKFRIRGRDFAGRVEAAGAVQPGQQVLINGASGGVGTCAVQIAKAYGAEVTSVCHTRSTDLVRSIGADHVIEHPRAKVVIAG